MMRRFNAQSATFAAELTALLHFDAEDDSKIEQAVSEILQAVKTRGDAALLEYTRRFDRVQCADTNALQVPRLELEQALQDLPPAQKAALEAAAARILHFHQRQKAAFGGAGFEYTEADGTTLGQRIVPLDSVGIYVPGGKAAYPSSVLMNAIPAKVAGVGKIVMVTPTPDGVKNSLVLAAACLAGVDQVLAIGGAQAVAALAYGTETIAPVDKITGPGNAYVAQAKRRVFGTVGIDMIAGPSEILIICDGTTNPAWVALDLFAQAEHDQLAQSILLCPQRDYLDQVALEIERLLPMMPRRDVIAASLEKRGALIEVASLEQACEIANRIAPEHLELSTLEPHKLLPRIRHAGAIFLGRFASEALGDYCCGPNHVLPTARSARFSSPLGVYDFQKCSSILEVSQAGAQTLGKIAAELAFGEGLQAHAQSALARLS